MHGGSYKYFVRGRSSTASHDDFTVRAGHKLRLRDHDMYLKKFQHRKALDAALQVCVCVCLGMPRCVSSQLVVLLLTTGLTAALCGIQTRDPVVVVSMFEELVRRDSLAAALTGRDDAALAPVLAFIVRYIARPRFSSCLIDVANSLFGECALLICMATPSLLTGLLLSRLARPVRTGTRSISCHRRPVLETATSCAHRAGTGEGAANAAGMNIPRLLLSQYMTLMLCAICANRVPWT